MPNPVRPLTRSDFSGSFTIRMDSNASHRETEMVFCESYMTRDVFGETQMIRFCVGTWFEFEITRHDYETYLKNRVIRRHA